MERKEKIMITAIVLVVIVAGFYFLSGFITSTTGYAIRSDDASVIGQCLQDQEVIFYTSPQCPDCVRQGNELKEVIDQVNVVDCSQNTQSCLVLNQLPAFEYEKGLYYGFKSLDEIRDIVDC